VALDFLLFPPLGFFSLLCIINSRSFPSCCPSYNYECRGLFVFSIFRIIWLKFTRTRFSRTLDGFAFPHAGGLILMIRFKAVLGKTSLPSRFLQVKSVFSHPNPNWRSYLIPSYPPSILFHFLSFSCVLFVSPSSKLTIFLFPTLPLRPTDSFKNVPLLLLSLLGIPALDSFLQSQAILSLRDQARPSLASFSIEVLFVCFCLLPDDSIVLSALKVVAFLWKSRNPNSRASSYDGRLFFILFPPPPTNTFVERW